MERVKISGIPVVSGAAAGKICYLNTDYSELISSYKTGSPIEEQEKFSKALKAAVDGLKEVLESRDDLSEEEEMIINTHLMLIEDEGFLEVVKGSIDEGVDTPTALLGAVDMFKAMFAELDDEYLRDRANDIVDVGNRILRKLLGVAETKIEGENLVLLAEDIEPAVMAGLSEKQVSAVLLSNGSKTSHTIIIAKSKGFATMVGVDLENASDFNGAEALVDATCGYVILNPSKEEAADFTKTVEKLNNEKAYLLSKAMEPAISLDGKEFTIVANVSSPDEMEKAREHGCRGVGLYRTEFLFMDSPTLPDEARQSAAYEELLSRACGDLCIIRTLDIGGDKQSQCLNLESEENPFLGYRAVRICLDKTEMFKTQLRALLRASVKGKLGVMVPMIDTVSEVKAAKALFEEAKAELTREGVAFDKDVKFGIMTETPASSLMAPILAKYVDFFSIGTNDLVQYTMAVDRGNQKVSYLYDYFDPAVIRSIINIVKAAHDANIMVGMCGEMAGDELAAPFLMAIGLDEFSMALSSAPAVKERIRTLKCNSCDCDVLLSKETAAEVREYLTGLLNG